MSSSSSSSSSSNEKSDEIRILTETLEMIVRQHVAFVDGTSELLTLVTQYVRATDEDEQEKYRLAVVKKVMLLQSMMKTHYEEGIAKEREITGETDADEEYNVLSALNLSKRLN